MKIVCKTSRDICLFLLTFYFMIVKNNSQLGYYLAGLIEGDGCIWTSKEPVSPFGRVHNPRIVFTFHTSEKPVFMYMKKHINAGIIYEQSWNNVCKYTIYSKDEVIRIINLINGKFRTPKIKYLHKAIDRINTKHSTSIEKLPLDNSNIFSHPWLTGMADSDGNFHISLEGVYGSNNSRLRGRVKCSFSIKQRVIDKPTGLSCVPFMTEIADLFECNINYKAINEMVFLVQADSKHYLTKSYFDKFPLMSSKHLDYLCYLQGLPYLGKRLTSKEITEIQAIKNSMNSKRTYFNWDHLINFYPYI